MLALARLIAHKGFRPKKVFRLMIASEMEFLATSNVFEGI